MLHPRHALALRAPESVESGDIDCTADSQESPNVGADDLDTKWLQSISIVAWWFRGGILAIGIALLAASWFVFRHWLVRWGARLLTVIVAIAFVGASINAHFGYFPTLGALLGRRAADQMSQASFRKLESALSQTLKGHWHSGWAGGRHKGTLPPRGVVISFPMPGTVSHFDAVTGQVYLPPIWFASPHPHLPVIVLLHGSPGSPADWTRAAFADLTADAFARTHGGFAPILVMPDENGTQWWHDSECVNGVQGRAEMYVTVDVRRAVERAFATRRDGASWGIGGLSEGGSCALQIALRHPNLFSAVGDFSGEDHPFVPGGARRLFFGSTPAQLTAAERSYDPRWLFAHWHHHGLAPAIAFAIGRQDGLYSREQHLFAMARRDHFDAEMIVRPGSHTFMFWGQSFAAALPFLVQRLDHPVSTVRLVGHGHGRRGRGDTRPRIDGYAGTASPSPSAIRK